MLDTQYLSVEELEAGMDHIRQAPREVGMLKMIVRRPAVDERETVQEAELTLEDGLVGDTWRARGSDHSPDGSALTEAQVTLMNARIIELIAQSEDRWPLAGDQLYVDFDLSDEHIPPGTQLSIGSAIVEVSALPHTGCKKFSARFGVEAMKFVNSVEGKQLHLRGINTRVVRSGKFHVGDAIRKL
jgi:MOSC domain-containing protein YiiM